MKKIFCVAALASLTCLAGCNKSDTISDISSQPQEEVSNTTENYSYVNVDQEEHLSNQATSTAVTFVSGMGCSDQNCTDPKQHHESSHH